MGLLTGQTVEEGDFISTSAGASDSGKVPKLNVIGQLDNTFGLKFGGDGSDGALTISSGTTNIDLGSAQVVIKNYTSISITGTGALSFSNPHANGTILILKSQGDVTLTSSATPMIPVQIGGAGGAGSSVGAGATSAGSDGTDGKSFCLIPTTNKGLYTSSVGGSAGTIAYPSTFLNQLFGKYPQIFVGAGGASGGCKAGTGSTATGGAGGRGGGALVIECRGALNFTTANGISVSGVNGTNGSFTGSNYDNYGGGGGAGGICIISYNSLTANSGTITVSATTGGTGSANGSVPGTTVYAGGGGGNISAGGNGSGKTGGTGPAGLSVVYKNNEFA
jgi:hypothetical protein